MIQVPNKEIGMRSLVGSVAVAAGVALSIGGFVSAIQAVEFHGLPVVVPGSGEIRFGNDAQTLTSTSSQTQIQTQIQTQNVHFTVDPIREASESAHG
jgi:hypothetical protein